MERIDPEKLEQWHYQLEAPVPGMEKAEPSDTQVETEGADFMAAMMQHQQLTGG